MTNRGNALMHLRQVHDMQSIPRTTVAEDAVADSDVEEAVVTVETIVDAADVVLVPRDLIIQTLLCAITVESGGISPSSAAYALKMRGPVQFIRRGTTQTPINITTKVRRRAD